LIKDKEVGGGSHLPS